MHVLFTSPECRRQIHSLINLPCLRYSDLFHKRMFNQIRAMKSTVAGDLHYLLLQSPSKKLRLLQVLWISFILFIRNPNNRKTRSMMQIPFSRCSTSEITFLKADQLHVKVSGLLVLSGLHLLKNKVHDQHLVLSSSAFPDKNIDSESAGTKIVLPFRKGILKYFPVITPFP